MSSGDPLPSIDKTEDDMSASPSPPSSSDGVEIEMKPLLGETRSRLKLSSRDSLENSGEDEKNLSRVDKEMPTSKNQNENELDVYDMTLPRRVARTPFLPGLNFNLGLGLHLILLDIVIGIPFSYTITCFNRIFIHALGYEKYNRHPSGILAHKILFCTLNIILIIHWSRQLYRQNMDKQIKVWGQIVEGLEEEKSRIDEILGEEANVQVLRETLKGLEDDVADGEVAVDGEFELPVPDQPVHAQLGKGTSPSFPTSPNFECATRMQGNLPRSPIEAGIRGSKGSNIKVANKLITDPTKINGIKYFDRSAIPGSTSSILNPVPPTKSKPAKTSSFSNQNLEMAPFLTSTNNISDRDDEADDEKTSITPIKKALKIRVGKGKYYESDNDEKWEREIFGQKGSKKVAVEKRKLRECEASYKVEE